jgi:hypothetical protein
MMTILGKNNHPLPSIGVITHTISQFTSSYMEKNMKALSTPPLPLEHYDGSDAPVLL